jgi:hypothetical protein
VPLLLLGPQFFPIILFGSTTLLTGMTGISLHMQWPLTSQSHGGVSQRKQLDFFVTEQNSTPIITQSFSVENLGYFRNFQKLPKLNKHSFDVEPTKEQPMLKNEIYAFCVHDTQHKWTLKTLILRVTLNLLPDRIDVRIRIQLSVAIAIAIAIVIFFFFLEGPVHIHETRRPRQ